jgi:hypothetical protein
LQVNVDLAEFGTSFPEVFLVLIPSGAREPYGLARSSGLKRFVFTAKGAKIAKIEERYAEARACCPKIHLAIGGSHLVRGFRSCVRDSERAAFR